MNGTREARGCSVTTQKFNGCVESLRSSGQGFLVPDDRPVHGVGHSNGALLHLLIGAILAPANASNALISFNNKCACSLACRLHHIFSVLPGTPHAHARQGS